MSDGLLTSFLLIVVFMKCSAGALRHPVGRIVSGGGKMRTCGLADWRTCNLRTKNLQTATADQLVNC